MDVEAIVGAISNAGDIPGWMAALSRAFAAAPSPPELGIVGSVEGGRRLVYHGPGTPADGIALAWDDPLLSFLAHPHDLAIPLDLERTVALHRFLTYLGRIGTLDHDPPLPMLAGSVRHVSRSREVVSIVCWWSSARAARWVEDLKQSLLTVAPLLAQAGHRLINDRLRATTALGHLFQIRDVMERRFDGFVGHGERVGGYMAAVLGAGTRDAGLLHDIGELYLSEELFRTPDAHTELQQLEIERHPMVGVEAIEAAGHKGATAAVAAHHERWDGAGYPLGLAGEAIPLEARVLCVCEAFDAMTHPRPHRPARTIAAALGELRSEAGRQFAPDAVEAFEGAFAKGAIHAVWAEWALGADRVDVAESVVESGLETTSASDRLDLLLFASRVAAHRARWEEATLCLNEASDLAACDPRVSLGRAQILHDQRSHPTLAREAIEETLARTGAHALSAHATARNLLANLDRIEGRIADAQENLAEARRLMIMLGDTLGEARITETMGNLHLWSGDLALAERCFSQSEASKIARGDHMGRAISLGNQARLAFFRGDLPSSARLFTANLGLARRLGDARGQVVAQNGLGVVLIWSGDPDGAVAEFTQAVEIAGSHNPWGCFYGQNGLVQANLAKGNRERAEELLKVVRSTVAQLDSAQPRAVLGMLELLVSGGSDVSAMVDVYRRLTECGDVTLYEQAVVLGRIAGSAAQGATLSSRMTAEVKARHDDRLGWIVERLSKRG